MNIIFIVVPNFYIINEYACPPLQLEPFYNYLDAEIIHIKRGQPLSLITEADVYCITAYTEDYPMAEMIARFLRSRNQKSLIALGGCHATFAPSGISDIFDYVIVGNGEKFIEELSSNAINLQYEIMQCEQNIRWDSRSFKHFVKYNPNYHRDSSDSYTLRTSFGCYWRCSFCAHGKWDGKVQFRNLKDIENQLTYLKAHGVNNIRVIDEIFSSHPHFEAICNMLSDFSWNVQDRIDMLSPGKCKILGDNGCRLVQVGVESFCQDIRIKLNKKLSDKKLINGIKIAKDAGLILNAFIMLGTPFDTEDSIKHTKNEAIRLFGYENIRPDIFIPYHGTNIGDNPEHYNLRIIETAPEYYSTFMFQNTHGKLVAVPKHVSNIDSWERLLRETLYELAPSSVRSVLDNPIERWYDDAMYCV